ncbi:hypothetical protein ABMC89_00550 [Sulfitobacter sp. HNIBRBA3233]|uniref:calcium-binding protein n=1 Tax=Sulfitobacter marinivivus TaxID=3158558 RepID=UPI0032DF4F40
MSPLIVLLLASLGPLMVGFLDVSSDPETDDEETDDTAREDTSDPVEIVDVVSFIENARTFSVEDGEAIGTRGGDGSDLFDTPLDQRVAHDASGGEDTLIGSNGADTLVGGEGSDTISGGDGDDALFGGHNRQTRPDDDDADTIFGEEGDDTLFLGNGDIGSGGAGNDVFAMVADADETVTITDFDPAEDALAIEVEDPEAETVTDQQVDEEGLSVRLSTGLTLRLTGLGEPLSEDSFQFVRADPIADA